MTATRATPTIELPPGTRLLSTREIARRMGVTVETADKLLSEGNLIAFQVVSAPAQVHIEPVAKYAVTLGNHKPERQPAT